jgi:uncharacterized membrane protein (UPF0182 family)
LLVIPIDHSFLYVEPVFMLAEGANIPQLKRVIVSDGTRVAMGSGVADALQVLFGQKSSTSEETAGTSELAIPGAREAFSSADHALRQGDWSTFGREWEHLRQRTGISGQVQLKRRQSGSAGDPSLVKG